MRLRTPTLSVRAWIALLCGALMIGVQCLPYPADAAAPDFPMQFTSQYTPIPVNATDSFWILAEGRIDARTPERFLAFWDAEKDGREPYVLFNSAGGDIEASMRLGRLIRERRLETLVFSEPVEVGWNRNSDEPILQDSECLDVCVFAFLGGLERAANDQGRIGVRQFQWPMPEAGVGSRAQDVDAAIGRAALIAKLMSYMREMGADAKLVELALSVPPTDPARLLTPDELRALNVDTWILELASWKIEPRRGGIVAKVRQSISATDWFEASLYCHRSDNRPILEVTSGYTHPMPKHDLVGKSDLSLFTVDEVPGKPTFMYPNENRVIFTRINKDGSGTFRINPSRHEIELMSRGLEFYTELKSAQTFTRSRVCSKSHFVAIGAAGSLVYFRRAANAALRNCLD